MKVEYLIDGYNLLRTRAGGRLKPGPGNLERARRALLSWIADGVADPGTVTVVFDASAASAPQLLWDQQVELGIKVLFAHGYQSADALISELCQKHSHPKQLLVVSDDREIRQAAKRRKARPVSCQQFEAMLQRPPQSPHQLDEPSAKRCGPNEAEKTHWLEVFGAADQDQADAQDPLLGDFRREMRKEPGDEDLQSNEEGQIK